MPAAWAVLLRSAGRAAGSPAARPPTSDRADVLRLRALLALRDVELDALRLVQRAVAAAGDGREVAEHVGAAAVLLDEAEALLRVEPLHCALGHVVLVPCARGAGAAVAVRDRRTDRQDREERQAETTADVRKRMQRHDSDRDQCKGSRCRPDTPSGRNALITGGWPAGTPEAATTSR